MGWIPIILYVKHVSYFVYLSGYFFFAMNYWILAIGEIDNVVYLTERGSVTRLLEVRFDKTAESIWHITWYNLLSWAAELCCCWHKNVTVEWETWRPYTCTITTSQIVHVKSWFCERCKYHWTVTPRRKYTFDVVFESKKKRICSKFWLEK